MISSLSPLHTVLHIASINTIITIILIYYPSTHYAQTPISKFMIDSTLRENDRFIIKHIYFEYNKSIILPESKNTLDSLVSFLNKNQQLVLVEIQNHSSEDSQLYSTNITHKRAQEVVNYLIKNGVAAKRLTPKGYGASDPIATNNTPENRARNRRTVLKIITIRYP